MTKAEIVSEIAKTIGIDKAAVLFVVEQYDGRERQPRTRRERISPWLRFLHCQAESGKDGPRHQQKYYARHPGSQHPGIQTRQLLQGRNRKVIMEEENGKEQSKVETIHIQSNKL